MQQPKISYEIYYAIGPHTPEYLYQADIETLEAANSIVIKMQQAGKKGIQVVKVTRQNLIKSQEPRTTIYSDKD